MGTCKIAAVLLLCAAPVFSRPASSFKSTEAKAHYEKALEYGNQNLWAPAILELNRARAAEPGNPEILIELGIAHGELKDWKNALATLRKAVNWLPARCGRTITWRSRSIARTRAKAPVYPSIGKR